MVFYPTKKQSETATAKADHQDPSSKEEEQPPAAAANNEQQQQPEATGNDDWDMVDSLTPLRECSSTGANNQNNTAEQRVPSDDGFEILAKDEENEGAQEPAHDPLPEAPQREETPNVATIDKEEPEAQRQEAQQTVAAASCEQEDCEQKEGSAAVPMDTPKPSAPIPPAVLAKIEASEREQEEREYVERIRRERARLEAEEQERKRQAIAAAEAEDVENIRRAKEAANDAALAHALMEQERAQLVDRHRSIQIDEDIALATKLAAEEERVRVRGMINQQRQCDCLGAGSGIHRKGCPQDHVGAQYAKA